MVIVYFVTNTVRHPKSLALSFSFCRRGARLAGFVFARRETRELGGIENAASPEPDRGYTRRRATKIWRIKVGTKADEAIKIVFFLLLIYFNSDLQNGFTLQCLDLRKIDEAEAGISRAKEALSTSHLVNR